MNLMAVDPGEHVGWATYHSGMPHEPLKWGVDDFDLFLHRLGQVKVDIIIYEDYTLYGHLAVQQTGSHFVAVQVIGAIKMWTRAGQVPPVAQPASLKTSLVDEEMARLCGLEGKHALRQIVKSPHARDAIRHMLIYLLRSNEHGTAAEIARRVR